MGRRILVITDMADEGSGYKTLCGPLLTGLTERGHEIKVAGISYRGSEHHYPFSVIPTPTPEDAYAIAINLVQLWFPDVILVAMDLPFQVQYIKNLENLMPRSDVETQQGLTGKRKYIAITPLENGPLRMGWAAPLLNADSVFFISELGKQEAIKAGVLNADHIVIGIDHNAWHPATTDERVKLREGLGISQDAFVVLTVAENQERKNLSAALESVALLKKDMTRPLKYIMVTREHSPVGWGLREYATELGINQDFVIFERGMPQKDLWGLYAIADVYLQTSKAEGLGLPVMEAMACGVPVVATDTGAMHELLEDGRGFLVPAHCSFRDPWGNSRRDMIDTESAARELLCIGKNLFKDGYLEGVRSKSLEYIHTRTWDVAVQQMHNRIEELYEQKS